MKVKYFHFSCTRPIYLIREDCETLREEHHPQVQYLRHDVVEGEVGDEDLPVGDGIHLGQGLADKGRDVVVGQHHA